MTDLSARSFVFSVNILNKNNFMILIDGFTKI